MKKAILASVVIVAGVLGLWFYARPAYRHHRETQAVEQARAVPGQGRLPQCFAECAPGVAAESARRRGLPDYGRFGRKSRSPYVLDWRRRIVEAAPTVENKLLLASSALRAQAPPYPLTAETLAEIKGSATNVAAYHAVSAELALRLKRPAEAATQFEQASQLEPTNELYQLNLAVLRLQSTNALASSPARATLERLRASPTVGAVALRWLVADGLGRGDLSAAEQFSRQLLADPRSLPDDRLQHLTILRQSKNPELGPYLSALQKSALTNALESTAFRLG